MSTSASRHSRRGPATLSPIAEAHLLALRDRVRRGLATLEPSAALQLLALAEQYLTQSITRHGAGAAVIPHMLRAIEPLRARCAAIEAQRAAKAAPPKHLTTVGELKALLAGLPDHMPLSQVPCVNPDWSAQAAEALRLMPPVTREPSRHPALRQGTPFGMYGTPTAEDLLGA